MYGTVQCSAAICHCVSVRIYCFWWIAETDMCRAVPCGSCANAAQSMRDERGAHTQKFLLLQAARRGESTECVSSVSGGLVI